MNYISTRGNKNLGNFFDVLLTGLAPDGGLSLPEKIPQLSLKDLENLKNLSYQDLALEIMKLFISNIDEADLREIIKKSYSAELFGSPEITPLRKLENKFYILGLSNGPSLAFKDVAMQFLGNAFAYELKRRGEVINIVGATSGDTGSAAEYAMRGKENINVFMLSPQGRMSDFQRAQMYSLNEPNIFNIAVNGVFDDCQDLVKAVNANAEFKEKYSIGAVNSINWARVLAQSVYYFKASFALNLTMGEVVDFSVPSGNFGDVFAGFLAKKMGLPIRHLIVATNENDVLDEFFKTGIYRPRPSADVAKTSSPSMDIGKASNFERYLFFMANGDFEQVKAWQEAISKGEAIDLKNSPYWDNVKNSQFLSAKSSHSDRLKTIEQVFNKYGEIIDPHTADGILAAQTYFKGDVPMICLETALAAKFAETVQEAIKQNPPRPEFFKGIEEKPQFVLNLENNVESLEMLIIEKLKI